MLFGITRSMSEGLWFSILVGLPGLSISMLFMSLMLWPIISLIKISDSSNNSLNVSFISSSMLLSAMLAPLCFI
ncbi:membrane protein [Candidatus Magnetobacterium bavaricum]|uniref:Membrane protein n=1 Tax=Candidatus Magnetobacterium bavaricum TaxID=29290 RepID=A0A0F3GP86_9BACT|nr:membrane protein [Candidatus Magnetobacterium bavaricum]